MIREMKTRIEKAARQRLLGSALFFPVRENYQRVFAREKWVKRARMRAFYAQFVRRSELVFDVGAHLGVYAECFTALGAKVVAIEPNPACRELLKLFARNRDIQVENCAAGDAPGKTHLHICVDYSSISTVDEDFYDEARHSSRHGPTRWLEPLDVDVVTLDQLAARYGIPSFVKIDVEGFDDHVIRGISFAPEFLSFEFNRDIPQVALRCLDTPLLKSGYMFNYSCSASGLASVQWMSAAELSDRIFSAENYFGDVFAHRIPGAL